MVGLNYAVYSPDVWASGVNVRMRGQLHFPFIPTCIIDVFLVPHGRVVVMIFLRLIMVVFVPFIQ